MDLETATTRLYEDPSLTEDLIDEEAMPLLTWTEKQLPALIAQYPDEMAFEEAFKRLRSFVKGVNRVIGQGDTMDETEKQERLTRIAQAATELGYRVQPIIQAQSALPQTKLQALEALLASVTPASAENSDTDTTSGI